MAEIDRGKLRALITERGRSMRAVSLAAGLNETGVKDIVNGKSRDPGAATLAAIAEQLGVATEELFKNGGRPARPRQKLVPLVGYVGAGAEAHFYATADEHLDMVEGPENATPQTRAAEVRGESLGPLFEHWLVFYDDVRTPVTPDLIGHLCVVGLPNDKVLVKKIQRSRTDGLYHLLSNSEAPMLDQEVIWAARVRSMTPR